MGFFSKLFKKRTYKNKKIQMAKQATENIYVWQKSERLGKIVVEKELKDGWLYFTDGSRINPKLVNEFLSRAENMQEAEEIAKILLPASGIVPAYQEPKVKKNEVNTTAVNDTPVSVAEKVDTGTGIVTGIIDKLSKKKKTYFSVKVGVNIPGKTVYSALKDDLDEEELIQGLDQHVENQINNIIEDIKNQVKTQITKNYE